MTPASVALFCMADGGHSQRMRPIIASLARCGLAVHVFTDARIAGDVTRAGARFHDLFEEVTVLEADSESRPLPSRFVTFAARAAEGILRRVRALGPSLVVYDGFAVIGRVVAEALGLPHVHACAGHNVQAARFRALLETDPRVRLSPVCLAAASTLRERYGLADASPFAYVAPPSPHLNLCSQPEEFLTEEERRAHGPLAFVGSLPDPHEIEDGEAQGGPAEDLFGGGGGGGGGGARGPRVYASFGTVAWRYFAREALAALGAVADAVAARPGARAVLSLGNAPVGPDAARALERPNVRVLPYVDQWSVLARADVFVTHHGLSSTHEAIFRRVPMVSYPFFWDQPGLAARCRELGLAVPLVEGLRAPVGPADVGAALDAVLSRRGALAERLTAARGWEMRTIAGRAAVARRIAEMATGRA